MRRFSFVSGAIAMVMIIVFVPGSSATAEDYYWQADPTGNWSDPFNWLDSGLQPGEPTSSDHAYINNGGTAEITQAVEECYSLILGESTGDTGTVEMSGGSLSTRWIADIGKRAVGTFNQSGGTNTTNYWMVLGYGPGGNGTYNQSAGTNNVAGSAGLTLGRAGTGTYNLMEGELFARREYIDNQGTFNHTGGRNTVDIRDSFTVDGTYNLSGTGELSAGRMWIGGLSGMGTFNHSAGRNMIDGSLRVGWAWASGAYNLSGTGQLEAHSEEIQGGATFTQSGGTNSIDGSLIIALLSDEGIAGGTYNLGDGTLTFKKGTGRKLSLRASSGIFNFGDANGTGTINETGSGDGIGMNVRDTTSTGGAGTFRGWGTVALTGGLVNNGRIIADGYGTDRTLDLSTFAYVMNFDPAGNVQDDGTLAGWVAQDHGKLVLPPIDVATGNHTYNWAEHPADGQIDLVNSVRMTLTNVTSGGDFSIELLAADRDDLPSIQGVPPIGLWDFIPPAGFAFGRADLTFRYDDALAVSLGLNENELRVYHFIGGSWVDVTSAIDTTNKWLHAGGITSFSTLAVGVAIPEPGTLALLSMAAVVLLVYTWRSRKQPR